MNYGLRGQKNLNELMAVIQQSRSKTMEGDMNCSGSVLYE